MNKDNSDIIATWDWRIRRLGYTAQQFTRLIGVTHSSFSNYKSGKQTPRARRFQKIEDVLSALEKQKGFA